MTDLAPQKARAWSYAVKRGFLNPSQAKESLDYGLSAGGPSLRDIREALLSEAAKADKEGKRSRHHSLLLALTAIDDARNV